MTDLICKVAVTAVALLSAAGIAAADPADGRGGYYHHMWGDGYGYGFMGGGIMLISWLAIIALIVIAVRWVMDRGGPKAGSSSALDALKMRFAKGEIDAEDYEARRKLLED
jgi:putative membrane protein